LKNLNLKKVSITLAGILFLIAIVLFSYNRAFKEGAAGDFHVFWLAGKTMLEGGDIYYVPPGLRNFIYPPFAAFFFIPLGLMPFNIACFVFYLLNFCLIGVIFYFIKRLCVITFGPIKNSTQITTIAFLLCFKVYWNNIMMIQSNEYVFLFTLLAIFFFLKENENWAVVCLCIAISLKIYPILIAFWMVMRGSRWILAKFVLGGVLCISIPFLFMGVSSGFDQLNWYLHHFILSTNKVGTFNLSYANQSLSGVFGRLFSGEVALGETSYTLIHLGPIITAQILMAIKIFIFLASILFIFINKRKKIEANIFEASLLLLTIHLVSGVTWKAHLVSLFLPYMIVAAIFFKDGFEFKKISILEKLLMAILVMNSLMGQIIVGRKGQLLLNGYGEYALVMILLYVFIFKNGLSLGQTNRNTQNILK